MLFAGALKWTSPTLREAVELRWEAERIREDARSLLLRHEIARLLAGQRSWRRGPTHSSEGRACVR